MKKIDLNKSVLGLDGVEIKENGKIVTMGYALGNFLVGANKGEALKYYDWAVALHNGKTITLDGSDFKKIYSFVEDHDQLTILVKAQILKELDKATEE